MTAMLRFFRRGLLVFVMTCVASTSSFADGGGGTGATFIPELLFGPEFTFWVADPYGTNNAPADYNNVMKMKYELVAHLNRHLLDGQPEGARFHRNDKTFTSPNGWEFKLDSDQGVLEVTMKPISAADAEKYASDIQDAIFTSMALNGLYPALYGGGGHISLNGNYFIEHPLLFYNFLVDLLNHNELFLGIFGFDTNNALPFEMQNLRAQSAAKAILNGLRNNLTPEGIAHFLDRWMQNIRSAVSTDPYQNFWQMGSSYNRVEKYHAFNLRPMTWHPSTENRIELRGIRPQVSMDMWVRQIRLLHKRIGYLANLTEPLEFKPRVRVRAIYELREITADEATTPPVDAQEALRSFYAYVTESGEKWSDHRDYIWPQWVTDGSLEKFEASDDCSTLLKGR